MTRDPGSRARSRWAVDSAETSEGPSCSHQYRRMQRPTAARAAGCRGPLFPPISIEAVAGRLCEKAAHPLRWASRKGNLVSCQRSGLRRVPVLTGCILPLTRDSGVRARASIPGRAAPSTSRIGYQPGCPEERARGLQAALGSLSTPARRSGAPPRPSIPGIPPDSTASPRPREGPGRERREQAVARLAGWFSQAASSASTVPGLQALANRRHAHDHALQCSVHHRLRSGAAEPGQATKGNFPAVSQSLLLTAGAQEPGRSAVGAQDDRLAKSPRRKDLAFRHPA